MDYFSEECIGTELSVNPDENEGAETEKEQEAYKKALLDILISLEWIDIVPTVVDKVPKENQLLALPAGSVKDASSLVEAWSGGASKFAQLIVRTRNFYRMLVTLLSRESP